jgi:hypothetical protein
MARQIDQSVPDQTVKRSELLETQAPAAESAVRSEAAADPAPGANDVGLYGILVSHLHHQDNLLWSRVQLLIAVQGATLVAAYGLRTDLLGLLILGGGAALSGLIGLLIEKDQRDRDVNQELMDALARRIVPSDMSAHWGDQPPGPPIRFSTSPTWWPPLPKGRWLLRGVIWGFVGLDICAVVVLHYFPRVIP